MPDGRLTLTLSGPFSDFKNTVAEYRLKLSHSSPPTRITATFASDILFAFNRADLQEYDEATQMDPKMVLFRFIAQLHDLAVISISIVGHTDSIGGKYFNQRLSEKRAETIKGYFLSEGFDSAVIKTEGKGADNPVAPNRRQDGSDNPEGRAKNRRVEIDVLGTRNNR